MSSPDLLLSFILPAYNEALHLPSCILSLREAMKPYPDSAYEIIVCDNNSTDETAHVARSLGAVTVFEPNNQISKARNTGARAAAGRWLCFVDSDTIVPPALAQRLMELIHQPKIAGGGAMVQFDLKPLPLFPALVITTWNQISRLFRVAAGSFLFCRREAWVETGGFDETFYAAEELFFSQAIKKWGQKKGLGFKIISDAVALTSARKLKWNSQLQLFFTMLKLLRPGALTSQEGCSFWYKRPTHSPKTG
jgi:glycosyltransferase involved in cell wall biosynthesis